MASSQFSLKKWLNLISPTTNNTNNRAPQKNSDDSLDAARLKTHPIFHEMVKYESVFVDTLAIADPMKKKMTVKYLRIIFHVIDTVLEDVVENYKEYSNNITVLTAKMYQRYGTIESTAASQGIPDVFLKRITPRIIENLLTLTKTVDDLHMQHRYSNQCDEMFSFMDVYLLQIRNTYNAIGGIVNNMNGELHRSLEGSVFDDNS